MGDGKWDELSFRSYSTNRGRSVSTDGVASTQGMFDVSSMKEKMKPYNVIRECVDSEDHPNTVPVMLALDVTGSMGKSCKRTASTLNVIMKDLYKKYKDIEFMICAIGDLSYDIAPLQVSQFESDIRIAESVDDLYLEKGGGPNTYESYTASWYFGLYHTKLDCHNRGKKGIIITMGDEPLNPYLPSKKLSEITGDSLQADVETDDLYKKVIEKFDVYHIAINDPDNAYRRYKDDINDTWGSYLGQNLMISTVEDLPKRIVDCIDNSISGRVAINETAPQDDVASEVTVNNGAIRW